MAAQAGLCLAWSETPEDTFSRVMAQVKVLLFTVSEPQHDKTNKMTCAPSEDSDQPGHPPSLHCPHEETSSPLLPTECTAKTDQTGQMPRLIQVFARRTGHFVDFSSDSWFKPRIWVLPYNFSTNIFFLVFRHWPRIVKHQPVEHLKQQNI